MFLCGGSMEKDRKGPGISLFVYYFSKPSMLSISPLSSTQAKTRLTQNRHNSTGTEDKKDRHMRFYWANWLRLLMVKFCMANRDFCMVSDRLMHVMNNKWNGEQMSSLIVWLLSVHFLFQYCQVPASLFQLLHLTQIRQLDCPRNSISQSTTFWKLAKRSREKRL